MKSKKELADFKRKVRASKEWKELKDYYRNVQNNIDPITLSKLSKSANLHHMSQNNDFYDDFSQGRFLLLNHRSHVFLHFCYNQYKKQGDFDFLKIIKSLVLEMDKLTKEDDRRI